MPLNDPKIPSHLMRQVLGNYPTGVCVITARDIDDDVCGLVVGSFTSVSLDPPLVGFFPDKRSKAWARIEATGQFAVNVLSSDQEALARQIAAPGENKFAGVDFALSARGLPILADGMVAIECTIAGVIETGDHWLVLGQVLAMESRRDADPMLFLRGRFGGFAAPVEVACQPAI